MVYYSPQLNWEHLHIRDPRWLEQSGTEYHHSQADDFPTRLSSKFQDPLRTQHGYQAILDWTVHSSGTFG